MRSRSRAEEVLAEADQLEDLLQAAARRPLSTGPGISEEYAEDLIAHIRAGRDAR